MPCIENEETIFNSERFSVVKQTIRTEHVRYEQSMVVLGSGVSLILLDSEHNVFLIQEWRAAVDAYITQLPGGYCGSDDDEKLHIAAKQEAFEEVGVQELNQLHKIKTYYPNGGIRNEIHIFFADNITESEVPSLEATEDIRVIKIPLVEAYKRFVLGDEMTTGTTIIGLVLAMERLHTSI